MAQPCSLCLEHPPETTACEQCTPKRYCSPQYLEENRVLHHLLCKPYLKPHPPPRPENTTLGLFFPIQGPPSFRLVKYASDNNGIVRPELFSLLGTDKCARSLLSYSVRQYKELPYTLQLFCRCGKQGTNSFVSEITQGTGYARHWGGPMVVLAHENLRSALDDPVWRDVVVKDLRWMFDFWRYGDEPLPLLDVEAGNEDPGTRNGSAQDGNLRKKKVRAVVIACEPERKLTGTFVQVEIGLDHPIFRDSQTQISVKIGLPLFMYKFPIQDVGDGVADESFNNPEAEAMGRIVDLSDPGWGHVADEWFGNIGTVLVVRADRKDLSARQMDTV